MIFKIPRSQVMKSMVAGQEVHIWNSAPQSMQDRHGYTKQGHGRHYMTVGKPYDRIYLDKAWDRRCDAARWAKRAGVKAINHWYLS